MFPLKSTMLTKRIRKKEIEVVDLSSDEGIKMIMMQCFHLQVLLRSPWWPPRPKATVAHPSWSNRTLTQDSRN